MTTSSYPRPMRSSAPDLKFSANTSKCGASESTSSRPASFFRSTVMLFFDRLLRRNVAPMNRPSGSTMPGCDPRPDSPVGASIFTTSAPRRASSCVAYGSACICSSASTRTPSSGFPYFAASSFATSPSRTRAPFLECREQGTGSAAHLPTGSDAPSGPRRRGGTLSSCAASSPGRPTCPIDGSTARRSPRSWARAGARAPARSRRSTRTPPRWASRRPASRCAAATSSRAAALRHHLPGLRRPHQRHRHPRRVAAARHHARVRLRGVGPVVGRRAAARAHRRGRSRAGRRRRRPHRAARQR